MIIVTGANGFIGSALVWELNRSGRTDLVCVDTIILDQRKELLRNKRFETFLGRDELWSFIERPEVISRVEAILHMGACSSTTELNVEFLHENNFEYTRRLWNWATKHQKTFIYASSGAVYGDGSQGFDDASAPAIFKPLNPYGESKAMFDRWVQEELRDKKPTPPQWFGLRFFNVFGPNENFKGDMSSVVFKAFHQIRNTGRLKLFRSHNPNYADGMQKRDFVYVKDITHWCMELMSKPNLKSGIYNMGFGTARTWLDLAHATFKALGRPVDIDWIDIPEDMRPRYQYFTEAKIDRLVAMGLSAPQWPLEKAVADYVENHLLPGASGKDPYL